MTRKIYTVLIIILVLLLSIFIQINFLNIVPLFGVAANIGIIIVVGFGLMNGRFIGGMTGAFYGLMIDILFSKTVGINFILYTLVGIITGQISNKFSKDNKTAMAMIVLITTAVLELLSCTLIKIIQGSDISFVKMIIIITIESAYNLILTAILHKFIVALGDMVNRAKNSYYLL